MQHVLPIKLHLKRQIYDIYEAVDSPLTEANFRVKFVRNSMGKGLSDVDQ